MTDQLCNEPTSPPTYPVELDLEPQKADAKHTLSSTCFIKALEGVNWVTPYACICLGTTYAPLLSSHLFAKGWFPSEDLPASGTPSQAQVKQSH